MRVCIYGTVFNNVEWVEESVKSAWRPDAEIVIVDSYSTDGTWEKLVKLRKDFNLRVYRYKCSRGLGRDIALRKCLEGSTVAQFDLDTVYNEAFHKVIDYGTSTGLRVLAGTLVAKREDVIAKGGWRDLNYGEDVEMVSRVGFDVVAPAVIGINAPLSASILRERRYGGLRRVAASSIDFIRGHAFSIRRVIMSRSKRCALFYLPALLMGLYKNREPDNITWLELASLSRCVRLRELGIPDRYFNFPVSLMLLKLVKGGEGALDSFVTRLVSRPIYKAYIRSRGLRVVYFKDRDLFSRPLLPLVERISLIE